MRIYFVRHGKTLANIKQTYNGIIDDPLSDVGIRDLKDKRELYQDLSFDYIYCSIQKRCRESFEILFSPQQVDEYREDIIEINFGDWAGQTYESVLAELIAKGYTLDDQVDPPNGETYEYLFARTTNFLTEIKAKHKDDEKILVVTHGIVISAIMKKHFLKAKTFYDLAPDNGLGYIVDLDADNYVVTKLERE